MNPEEEARRAFERDQQTRMREAHEFKTDQERQNYNRVVWEQRARAEEERRRDEEAGRSRQKW